VILPASLDIFTDEEVLARPTALKVYGKLLAIPEITFRPQPVKIENLARQVRRHRDSVSDALKLLIRLGYVVDSGRGQRNVRRVTLALSRQS
jgi:predicted transcriptional regulator